MRSALRLSSRRGCLPLLLAKAVLSTAAAVEVRRDRVDLLELSRKGEDFYQVQDSGWYCRLCPAGTYVAEHCKEQNGSSTCLPCEADGYVEYPSHFGRCLRCWTCREDQVELSPCNATRNTQCVCKNGTFCSPDHPCEMCQKCQSRCPSGQVKIAPCTPHSDLLCGPPTGSFSGSYMIVIVIIVALAAVLLLLLLWKRCCRHPAAGDSRDLGRKSGNVVVSRGGGSAPSLLCLQPPGKAGGACRGLWPSRAGVSCAHPPPGGWYHRPGWEQGSPARQLCVSLPPALPGAAADPVLAGWAGDAGQHPQRAPLPGPGAGAAPCRGGSQRPRAGGGGSKDLGSQCENPEDSGSSARRRPRYPSASLFSRLCPRRALQGLEEIRPSPRPAGERPRSGGDERQILAGALLPDAQHVAEQARDERLREHAAGGPAPHRPGGHSGGHLLQAGAAGLLPVPSELSSTFPRGNTNTLKNSSFFFYTFLSRLAALEALVRLSLEELTLP
uniref:Uncharacterized protein n=1 Tax=Anser cygnoides TaxID=8845 RepID=A0A8B9EPJ4_ANSCY